MKGIIGMVIFAVRRPYNYLNELIISKLQHEIFNDDGASVLKINEAEYFILEQQAHNRSSGE